MSKSLIASDKETSNLDMSSLMVPVGSFDNYVQTVSNIAVLTREEEAELATRYRDDDDLQAAEKLVISHLRYVVYIARGYSGYGLPLGDLVQEGNVGLMKSVKRFDPTVGVRLVSFAVHWIRAEMHEFILKNWRIVKVATTKAQRKLFFNLRSMKKRMGWFNQSEVNQVARDLGVKPEVVVEMESRLSGADITFDAPVDDNDENSFKSPAGYLPDLSNDPARHLEDQDMATFNRQRLHKALGELDERSQFIVTSRWLGDKKLTLQELAKRYEISAERVRQLENNAMKKIRLAMENYT
ncbi:RNA polymerase sigma factor RpoH [hydrothermal vent metagenome]|uniref:RNA polymerase sigma factor RpoH n=1 Tax=hydrothermal vent metagenome TaxID=652676 RepID=A0A3B0Z3N4_9ZZZZ